MLGSFPVVGPKAGDRLGPYELLAPIGRGGFALVWLARLRGSRGFEKLVAVKTIRPELAVDAAFDRMFVDEARIAAGIEHPNIARVVDFGEHEGKLFLVMEYVAGEPLSSLAQAAAAATRPIPIEVAVSVVADTCAGLHAAHELRVAGESLGVIHRDVSPQNILVTDSGIPKLVDFGIAKAIDRMPGDTSHGLRKGKVRYMAPEQVSPKSKLDRRVDVWAAGAVLYELLEGAPIHEGPNDMARLHAVVSRRPIAPFTKPVPPSVSDVVFRALSYDPAERWPTALAMREALLDALGQHGHRVSTLEIERFCEEVMPGHRTQREELVRQALAAADERELHEVAREDPLPSASGSTGESFALSSEQRLAETRKRGAVRLLRWSPVAVAAPLVLALAVVASRSVTPASSDPAEAVAEPEPEPEPSVEAAPVVTGERAATPAADADAASQATPPRRDVPARAPGSPRTRAGGDATR